MSQQNLKNSEAQAKLREVAESIDFAMMATKLNATPFHAVPMSTKKVDEFGNIWFLSGKSSDHNLHIMAEGKAHLIYSNPSDMQFLSVYGEATITSETDVLKGLYEATDDMWFDGVDDENLTAIKIAPLEAYYWDTKYNKLVTLFKFGAGLMTGEHADVTVSGRLEV